MLGGYLYKFLWVNLLNGQMHIEIPEDTLLRDFIGGYGIAARLYYERMSPGIDPLGPKNILGFTTGPLTGSPIPTGTRWTVTCKSPLTSGWGDANGSGYFGQVLKSSGFDAVFFTGIAAQPVYLYIEDGHATLYDAGELWGLDCYAIDDWAKVKYGKDAEVACIGPAGERLALISAIIHAKGRAAARSGVGAVMGSKHLKALVVKGTKAIHIADIELAKETREKYVHQINTGTGSSNFYRKTGTPGYTSQGIYLGDSPTKNWGVSSIYFPDPDALSYNNLLKYRVTRNSCWHCPISCWGTSKIDWVGKEVEAHQPEYETSSAFGSMLMNNNLESIIKCNELCNRFGLDTISAGSCLAFAFECFEHGLITPADTGGLILHWGDPYSIVRMLEKIALREDFGDVIADGVMRASNKIGRGSEKFAIHAEGQELPMHDPRFEPGMAVIYQYDATPGRHTQACQYMVAPGFKTERPEFGEERKKIIGRGLWVKEASCLMHMVNASGACLFGYLSTTVGFIADFLSCVIGLQFTIQDMLDIGERIANIRQVFNVREGINPIIQPYKLRAYGYPPLANGPTAGISLDMEKLGKEYLVTMGWTPDAAIPTRETLERVGLNDIAADLWK
jgi:aldehyde:ferredoxin oxidoreductase